MRGYRKKEDKDNLVTKKWDQIEAQCRAEQRHPYRSVKVNNNRN